MKKVFKVIGIIVIVIVVLIGCVLVYLQKNNFKDKKVYM